MGLETLLIDPVLGQLLGKPKTGTAAVWLLAREMESESYICPWQDA